MTTLLVSAGAQDWAVAIEDGAVAAADLFQALATGRALDEADMQPVAGSMRLDVDRSTLAPAVDGDGVFGWAGVPRAVWGGNAAVALPCRARLDAPGFQRLRLDFTLPAQPTFPSDIDVLDLGAVELHRLPVAIRGRVVSADGTPRPGAEVTISGLWHRRADHVDDTSPSTIGMLAAVAPGLARTRTGAGLRARVRQLQLNPEHSALLEEARPGAQRIRVSAGVPFAPGSATKVIVIAGLGDTPEIVHVDAIASPVTPDEVLVDLRHPLAQAHARGAEVRNAQLTSSGTWSPIQHLTQAGDRSVALATAAALSAVGDFLEIEGGGVPTEVALLTRTTATADARGFYSLPLLHRAALVRLHAEHAAEPQPAEATFVLEPSLAAARGDIVFPA